MFLAEAKEFFVKSGKHRTASFGENQVEKIVGRVSVTAGGVELREVDSRSMASKIVDSLFVAGELLDVDGPIGGYNFQAAFSTGRAAGIAAATR